jgi:hypothetical protein
MSYHTAVLYWLYYIEYDFKCDLLSKTMIAIVPKACKKKIKMF